MVRVILSSGMVITVWPCSLKNLVTVAIIVRCFCVPGTHNTLPVGSLFANGWYCVLKGSKLAGTKAMLSNRAFCRVLGGFPIL